MITRAVSLPTPAATLNGYLALPAGAGPHPGVVVIHEAYGLNDNIRDVAGRFAGEGHAALAVDLFTNRSRVVCMARLFGAMVTGREPATVSELSAALDCLIAQIHPGARHSFFNDQGRAYDASASEDAWRRTLSFFATQLAPRATA